MNRDLRPVKRRGRRGRNGEIRKVSERRNRGARAKARQGGRETMEANV